MRDACVFASSTQNEHHGLYIQTTRQELHSTGALRWEDADQERVLSPQRHAANEHLEILQPAYATHEGSATRGAPHSKAAA